METPRHPSSPPNHTSPHPWVIALGLFALAALVLIPGLNRGLIFDEYKTKMVAALSWPHLLDDRLGAGHLPTFFAIVKGWLSIVPYSNWQMRLPSYIFAALGVIPFYFLGRKISGPAGGLWTALFYIFNQNVLWAAQAARPYGPLLFFQGATVLAAVNWWTHRRFSSLAFAGIASILGILMMPLAGLTTLALILGLLATWRAWNHMRTWPLLGTLTLSLAVGLLPTIIVATAQTKLGVGNRGIRFPKFMNITEALPTMTVGDYSIWARGIMEYVALLIFAGILFFSMRKWPVLKRKAHSATKEDPAITRQTLPWRTWTLFWILVPLVVLILVTAFTGKGMVTHSRYQAPALGGVILLAGIALTRFRAAGFKSITRNIVTILVFLPLIIGTIAWMRYPGEGVAPVVRAMIETEGKIPTQVVGHARWLRLELPDGQIPQREFFLERRPMALNKILIEVARSNGHDVNVTDYDRKTDDLTELQNTVGNWANGQPFWIFVYIQDKEESLDQLAQNPPTGYRLTRKIKKGYARAYYLDTTP